MNEPTDWKKELRTLARAASDALDLLALWNAPGRANGTPSPFRGSPAMFEEGPDATLVRRGVKPARDVRTACQRAGIRGAEVIERHLTFAPWESHAISGDTVAWRPSPFDAPDAPPLAVTLAATIHVAMAAACDAMTGLLRIPRGACGSDELAHEQRLAIARALVKALVRDHVDAVVGAFAWNPPTLPRLTAKQKTAALVGASVAQVEAAAPAAPPAEDDDEVDCP